jgi:hypothetical protein
MNPYIEILNVNKLDLSFKSLSLDDIKLLFEALKENKILISLHLRANYIEEGSKYIVETLQVNNTLISLDLSYNDIGKE